MTAQTDQGAEVVLGTREYREIGRDLEGFQRLGAWEIKEIVDLALAPAKTTVERFSAALPPGTTSAEVRARVIFKPSPGTDMQVHAVTKGVLFER